MRGMRINSAYLLALQSWLLVSPKDPRWMIGERITSYSPKDVYYRSSSPAIDLLSVGNLIGRDD